MRRGQHDTSRLLRLLLTYASAVRRVQEVRSSPMRAEKPMQSSGKTALLAMNILRG